MNRQHANVPQGLIPVTKWNDYFDWPPIGGLRHIVFFSENNGFAPAIKRIGRRVLIDPERFWEIARGGAPTREGR